MSDTTIDDLLGKISLSYDHKDCDDACPDSYDYKEAKSALYDLILKEVVGEDEQPIDLKMTDKNTAIFINNKIAFCNGLRAEQRNKLKELFDERT